MMTSRVVRALPPLCLAALLLTSAAHAGTIRAVGVLGNSGVTGETLVRTTPFRRPSGVAVDRDYTLWVSMGDAISRIGLDGRLIERFPLDPAHSGADSRTFAVLDDTLYFLGLERGPALFALPMTGSPDRKAEPVPLALPPLRTESATFRLAPQPLGGRLVMAGEPAEPADRCIGVYLVDPRPDAPEPIKLAFTIPGEQPQGIAVDEPRGVIYIGGYFGGFVGGETHSTQYGIMAVRPDGTPISDAFPVPCTKTPAIPTQFRGTISLAGGALWDTAWYGFLARLDLQGHGDPGRVVEWHHELGQPTQVLEIPGDPTSTGMDLLCITTATPDAFYLAHWNRTARRLTFVRRIGCLSDVHSLGLSPDGWATVGTPTSQLWWRWDDPTDAPPRKAELHIGVTPGYWSGERFFALAAQYRADDLAKRAPVATIFTPTVGDRNEALRVSDPVPPRQPVGLSVQVTPGKPNAILFVTDSKTKQLWRTDFWLPDLRPDAAKWQPVSIEGTTLQSPTDVAALTDGRLLLGDEGRILLLEPQGDGYRVAHEFSRWGEGADQRLVGDLRFAVDGPWMLVTEHAYHRLVWLDWTQWQVLGEFGDIDRPGNDAFHLGYPTLVALSGTRALVADHAYQRVLKLVLEP